MARKIMVVPHNSNWGKLFRSEAVKIQAVFGEEMVAIHHIGSTAIPGIKAKPTIDILPEVRDISRVDKYNQAMIQLGYEPRGEYGIPGRRYFVKKDGDEHSHHVHIFQSGDPEITRHLNFVAYLRAHPIEAQAYSYLKEDLARKFYEDPGRYTEGKSDFIQEIDQRARLWKASL